jgi:hypothetical protein
VRRHRLLINCSSVLCYQWLEIKKNLMTLLLFLKPGTQPRLRIFSLRKPAEQGRSVRELFGGIRVMTLGATLNEYRFTCGGVCGKAWACSRGLLSRRVR